MEVPSLGDAASFAAFAQERPKTLAEPAIPRRKHERSAVLEVGEPAAEYPIHVSSIFDDADGLLEAGETVDAAYTYLGAGTIVKEDYQQPGVALDYDPADNRSYSGFDRFGRVVDQIWSQVGQQDPLDRFVYGYDAAGNRTSRTNALNSAFSETYQYDLLDRLTNVTRADDFDQTWTLDGLGNFRQFDDDGATQARTANAANEITGISSGVTPTYDAAGNMVSGPKSGSPATRLHYVFDAWNRLTAAYLDDGDGQFEPEGPNPQDKLIANYRYDGVNRRIAKELFDTTSGDPTGSTEFYHNAAWQVLEERLYDAQSNLTTAYQNVWSPRYIDAMVVRDTLAVGQDNQPGAIVLPARLLYLCDANFNVTGLLKQVDLGGGNWQWQVVERYLYDAYGKTTFLDAAWSLTVVSGHADGAASAFSNPTLYTGRYRDLETPLFYYRTRYYDVDLSRFIGRDPVGYLVGDANLYRYVRNNPVIHVDPSGQRITILDVRTEDASKGKKEQFEEKPLDFYNKYIDQFLAHLNKVPEATFNKLRDKDCVKFAKTVFKGTKTEYIALLNREKTSRVVYQNSGGYDSSLKKLAELAKDNQKSYDQTGVSVHGLYEIVDGNKKPTNEMDFHGEYIKNETAVKAIRAIGAKLPGRIVIISCFNNPGGMIESYAVNVRQGLAITQTQIEFNPATIVKYRQTDPKNDKQVSPLKPEDTFEKF